MEAGKRTEIEQACIRLSYAFAYCIDTRDYDGLVALFAADGVWERHGEVLSGRERIMEVLRSRPANQFTRHVVTNFHFTRVGETSASAVLYNMSWFSHSVTSLPSPFAPENALLLDFLDDYQLTTEGWKFSHRVTKTIFMAPSLMRH